MDKFKISVLYIICVGFCLFLFIYSVYVLRSPISNSRENSLYQLRKKPSNSERGPTLKSPGKNEVGRLSGPVLSQQWEKVGHKPDQYVFSAYYFEGESPYVQIIGMTRTAAKVKCTCKFEGLLDIYDVQGVMEILTENNRERYIPMYIRCPTLSTKKPTTVGIEYNKATSYLRVIYPEPRRYNFTVCVSCLHGPFGNYRDLIEMVETDRLLGADQFVVYNQSTTPAVDKVLQYYMDMGIMKVIQWDVPKVHVHYFGQVAMLQDCVFMNRQKSKYVVLKDIDEFIVPYKHSNWNDLMTELDENNPETAIFFFRNVFFPLVWKESLNGFNHSVSSKTLKLKGLSYIFRENTISPKYVRSKSILHPERVLVAGIHSPKKVVAGYKYHDVDSKLALLHHYRYISSKNGRTEEQIMRKFAIQLLHGVSKTVSDLGAVFVNGTYSIGR